MTRWLRRGTVSRTSIEIGMPCTNSTSSYRRAATVAGRTPLTTSTRHGPAVPCVTTTLTIAVSNPHQSAEFNFSPRPLRHEELLAAEVMKAATLSTASSIQSAVSSPCSSTRRLHGNRRRSIDSCHPLPMVEFGKSSSITTTNLLHRNSSNVSVASSMATMSSAGTESPPIVACHSRSSSCSEAPSVLSSISGSHFLPLISRSHSSTSLCHAPNVDSSRRELSCHMESPPLSSASNAGTHHDQERSGGHLVIGGHTEHLDSPPHVARAGGDYAEGALSLAAAGQCCAHPSDHHDFRELDDDMDGSSNQAAMLMLPDGGIRLLPLNSSSSSLKAQFSLPPASAATATTTYMMRTTTVADVLRDYPGHQLVEVPSAAIGMTSIAMPAIMWPSQQLEVGKTYSLVVPSRAHPATASTNPCTSVATGAVTAATHLQKSSPLSRRSASSSPSSPQITSRRVLGRRRSIDGSSYPAGSMIQSIRTLCGKVTSKLTKSGGGASDAAHAAPEGQCYHHDDDLRELGQTASRTRCGDSAAAADSMYRGAAASMERFPDYNLPSMSAPSSALCSDASYSCSPHTHHRPQCHHPRQQAQLRQQYQPEVFLAAAAPCRMLRHQSLDIAASEDLRREIATFRQQQQHPVCYMTAHHHQASNRLAAPRRVPDAVAATSLSESAYVRSDLAHYIATSGSQQMKVAGTRSHPSCCSSVDFPDMMPCGVQSLAAVSCQADAGSLPRHVHQSQSCVSTTAAAVASRQQLMHLLYGMDINEEAGNKYDDFRGFLRSGSPQVL